MIRQRSPSPPSDPAPRADDFDWPPKADDLSVYDIGPDPWHAVQDVASDTFAERHGDRSRRHAQRDRHEMQRLAGVLTAVTLLAGAAGWVVHRAMTRPAAVEHVHHPAPAVARPSTATPPRLRIIATYPLDAMPPPALPVAPPAGTEALAGMTRVAAPAAPAPLVAAAAGRSSDDSIRTLLQRYEEAYDQRDVRTAAALWPSLDQRALARAFAGLDRQDVEFDRCDIEASDAKGSAVCVGTVRYVPSVGGAVEKADRITWTFDLARSGEDWHIDALTAQ